MLIVMVWKFVDSHSRTCSSWAIPTYSSNRVKSRDVAVEKSMSVGISKFKRYQIYSVYSRTTKLYSEVLGLHWEKRGLLFGSPSTPCHPALVCLRMKWNVISYPSEKCFFPFVASLETNPGHIGMQLNSGLIIILSNLRVIGTPAFF